MPLISTWVLIAAPLVIPVDTGPATLEELTICELPKGAFVDPLPEVDDCAPDMSHEQTNDCLDELQDEVEALARNQAALEAQARCLCEALQRVAGDGSEASSPYDMDEHRCSFERP
jgi:hypothetical protein